jgi:hypothetical protein
LCDIQRYRLTHAQLNWEEARYPAGMGARGSKIRLNLSTAGATHSTRRYAPIEIYYTSLIINGSLLISVIKTCGNLFRGSKNFATAKFRRVICILYVGHYCNIAQSFRLNSELYESIPVRYA